MACFKSSLGGREHVITFEDVIVNEKGGFDAESGKFTSPFGGVYRYTKQE